MRIHLFKGFSFMKGLSMKQYQFCLSHTDSLEKELSVVDRMCGEYEIFEMGGSLSQCYEEVVG